MAPPTHTRDRFGRGLRDLRVSVTDRCNFRCPYCMPREVFGPDHAFVERSALLSFEEITRVVSAAAQLGVHKVRITGGEPLLRRQLPTLVGMLARLDGIDDIAMTTNASLLAEQAEQLAAAGLNRVTVSLDALDPGTFRAMADTPVGPDRVVAGIDAARSAGLGLKLNTVVRRGVNEDEVLPLAAYAREIGVVVRFIEFMDVGSTNDWRREDVVSAAEIRHTLQDHWPLDPVAGDPTEVARRWRYADNGLEVGFIASVTEPFCSTCVRSRLSAIGELYTCLFASRGHDVRALLRGGVDDAGLRDALAAIWTGRTDRWSEVRAAALEKGNRPEGRVEMSYIGG